MSGHHNPEPWRQPLRPILTSTITQSPFQELDNPQSWPRRGGDAVAPRSALGQEQRSQTPKRLRFEGIDDNPGNGVAMVDSKVNYGSSLMNSQIDVEKHDALEAPPSQQEEVKIPTFPPRPRRPRPSQRQIKTEDDASEIPRTSPHMKPYTLEVPKDAPKNYDNGHAGFFPWSASRKHPEDVLSEQSITSGYYDRVQIVPSEMTSARPLIWSSVKHKSGLQILSSLFTSALKRRQCDKAIASKCTFKLPPRVTLTDTKRETWLKDLADSTIPLRRLSRTIPHGIRGKALLDQCLFKNIPTWRAVWLVKCVGANEIRAFKRKGANGAFVSGGEHKWVKDWTIQVQQFLESLIDSCGNPDWRHRISYGLELVSHIYYEHLLERDSFLDWLCNATRSSAIDALPIWLLIVKMYLADLTACRRQGQELALALSAQYRSICSHGPVAVLANLRYELSAVIVELMSESPACFVFPNSWAALGETLHSCTTEHPGKSEESYKALEERNIALTDCFTGFRQRSDSALSSRLIEVLDCLPPGYTFRRLSASCLDLCPSVLSLVRTTLSWATTIYRCGQPRQYLAVRLLRHWWRIGIDIEQSIFGCLEAVSTDASLSRMDFYKIIRELTRSRHFSISKYLQWLMARGTPTTRGSDSSTFFSDLLDHIPTQNLPDYVVNLRRSLFGPFKNPPSALAKVKLKISAAIGFMAEDPENNDCPSYFDVEHLSGLLPCDYFEIAQWMRQSLFRHVCDNDDDNEQFGLDDTPVLLSVHDFNTYFRILDNLNEYSILADILAPFIEFGPKRLLTVIAGTVNFCFDIFHAMGAADDLLSSLLRRLSEIVSRSMFEKSLITSLIDLADALPSRTNIKDSLERELASIEYSCITEAGSPVADYTPEMSQNVDADFLNDIDFLLKSGSSMDRPVLQRIFADVSSRLESVWFKDDELLAKFYDTLARLKWFDFETFDDLILAWLEKIALEPRRPPLVELVMPLISNASVSLEHVVDRVYIVAAKMGKQLAAAIDLLDLLLFDAQKVDAERRCVSSRIFASHVDTDCPQEFHRYLAQRRNLVRTKAELLTPLLIAIFRFEHSGGDLNRTVIKLTSRPFFSTLLQTYLWSTNTSSDCTLQSALILPIESQLQRLLQAITVTLPQVEPPAPSIDPNESTLDKGSVMLLVRATNEFNVNLCRLRLASAVGAFLKASTSPSTFDEIAELLVEEAQRPEGAGLDVWKQLLSMLPKQVLLKFQTRTIDELFRCCPEFSCPTLADIPLATDIIFLDHRLGSTGLVEQHLAAESRFQILSMTAEKLRRIFVRLCEFNTRSEQAFELREDDFQHSPPDRPLRTLLSWLPVFLRLLTIHRAIFSHPKLPQPSLARLTLAFSLLLTHPAIGTESVLATRLFDFLATLSDYLMAETRQQCYSTLTASPNRALDPRIRFLFGPGGRDNDPPLAMVNVEKQYLSTDGRPMTAVPYALKRWEMVSNAAPILGENDTSIDIRHFGAKKAVL